MTSKQYSLAEFFCGCGGTSRGFTRSGRFNVAFGNDVKKHALQTFELNHRHDQTPPKAILEDIRQLDTDTIQTALRDRGVRMGDLDCMIGGPPCQGFSQMRRTEHRQKGKIVKFSGYSQIAHDPRNDLVLRYLEVAEALRPKFLLIENVPQMLNHGFDGRLGKLSEVVIKMLEEMGYQVEVGVLNCADYGTPQLRERAVFIASAIGPASFPEPTHTDPANKQQLAAGKLPWVTVGDAISDLPTPTTDEELGGGSTDLYRGEPNAYTRCMRSASSFPFHHITRTYSSPVLNIISKMKPGKTWDHESARIQQEYEQLIKQRAKSRHTSHAQARAQLEREKVINPAFYKKYYWSAYTRLDWKSPALTITANANFLGSGRFTHPTEQRGITVREAARLQSFDDDFAFATSEGAPSDGTRIGVAMDMIGEAVPPALSRSIANHLAKQLDGNAPATKRAKALPQASTARKASRTARQPRSATIGQEE